MKCESRGGDYRWKGMEEGKWSAGMDAHPVEAQGREEGEKGEEGGVCWHCLLCLGYNHFLATHFGQLSPTLHFVPIYPISSKHDSFKQTGRGLQYFTSGLKHMSAHFTLFCLCNCLQLFHLSISTLQLCSINHAFNSSNISWVVLVIIVGSVF